MNGRPSSPRRWVAVAAFAFGTAAAVCADVPVPGPQLLGGDTTVFDEGPTAFGRALANLGPLRWNEFRAGKVRFTRQWPARGPWADAASCAECHYHDGRGPQREHAGAPVHLVRLSGPRPGGDPVYGRQLRRTGYGVPAPARVDVEWTETRQRYPDGDAYTLRRPRLRVSDLAYGPIDRRTQLSLRVAPAVFGLGLLDAVSEETLRRLADPEDRDGDGVSGRLQQVRNPATGRPEIGRFGWKAGQPTLAAQAAAALLADLGVVAPSTAAAADGMAVTMGSRGPEIDESDVAALVDYLRALAVPARRHWTEAIVREGEALFGNVGCAACHRPEIVTGRLPGWPELTAQTIRPYTDLLLHDLGPQLGDDVREGLASGREWRTPPLWGLGLLATVSGQRLLLHDGRARSPEEAILWHGGEAAAARDRFRQLRRHQRTALLAFLETL